MIKTPLARFSTLLTLLLLAPVLATAQPLEDVFVPATTGGVATVDRALAKLSVHRRLLIIAAHPDDEDTSLLALVTRGLGGEAAYLSLNRGEGGQNLIGTELGVGLGLIRSGELLAARRVDGAHQFFTRAFDFGYTRSLEETLERWPREILMEDARRIVRRFRPQVVVSIFPPTTRAGHGQHQAAGLVAMALFEEEPPLPAAGEAYPWQPQALYRAGWFDRDAEALEFSLGRIDPLDGRSILQLALASRSHHRSQDMGNLQEIGSRTNRLIPVKGKATTHGDDPFAGIDTRLAAIASNLPEGELRRGVESHLGMAQALAQEARESLSPSRLAAATPAVARILGHLKAARELLGNPERRSPDRAVAELIDEKITVAHIALSAAAGIVQDAFTDRGTLVPGETFQLTGRLWNSSSEPLNVTAVEPRIPPGWTAKVIAAEGADSDSGPLRLEAGETRSWEWEVRVPSGAQASRPYFLERPLVGDLYDWTASKESLRGEPFEPAWVSVRFATTVEGEETVEDRAAVHRYRDQARGEIRRPLRVVPALEVAVSPALRVWPIRSTSAVPLEVKLTNHRSEAMAGEVLVEVPSTWPKPSPRSFEIAAGGQLALHLVLEPPAHLEAGDSHLRVTAKVGEKLFDLAVPPVRYDHVAERPWPHRSEALVRVGDLALPAVDRVGYIRGASDRVPEALRSIGLPIDELSTDDLALGDLRQYPVIVVGSRAYETDQGLAEANDRLLDYVRNGGRLIVQYQQYQFVRGSFAPFSLEISRPHGRVTDETAAVTLLRPDHAFFHSPNVITEEDWQGWVQERGLYFPSTWDERFIPLLAMTDPEQPEQRGALLVANLGRGTYIYTGLAFFRQLPAGVIGGYRLFLNLLDVGDEKRGEQ